MRLPLTPRHGRRIGVGRVVAVVSLLSLVVLAPSGVASADPVADKRAEAARVQAQIDAQAERIAAVDRRLRQAEAKAAEIEAAAAKAQADLEATTLRHQAAQAALASQAVNAYVHGGAVSQIEQLSRSDGHDLALRRRYMETSARSQRQAIDDLKVSKEDLDLARRRLRDAHRAARSATDRIGNEQSALEQSEADQQANLRRVNGELGGLVAQEQARRNAEAAQRAQAAAAASTASRPAAPRDPVRPVASPTGEAPAAKPAAPGGVWACIRQLESGNNYRAPGGGAYQIIPSTWASLGGSGRAEDASPAEQDAMAIKLQQRSGWSQWTTAGRCGAYD